MKYNLIIVLALSLLLLGCIPFLGGGNPPPIKVDYNSVHMGAQGIVFSFAPDRPQATYDIVPSGNDITVIVGLENKGAWDVLPKKGFLTINYDKSYVNIPENTKEFSLDGRSLTRSQGDKVQLDFNGKIKPLEEIKKDTPINAIACYEYGTEYTFDVCIDTDPTNTKPIKKACDLLQNKKKYNSLSGEGAPVAITSLDQAIKINDNKLDIDFIIKVKNLGNGKIYDVSASPETLCRQGGELDKVDKVTISAELAGEPLNCETNEGFQSTGTMYVREGTEGVIDCRVAGYVDTNVDSFISKLKVTLNYDYVDSNGKNIILRKAGARG